MAPLIEFENVGYAFPDGQQALRDVSLAVGEGEVVLLLGPSGSGKSTLLRAVNGLVPHFSGGTFAGRVRVAGFDTRLTRPRDLAAYVGMVFQDPESQSVMTTVEREIAFGLENHGISSSSIGRLVEESLVLLGLSRLRRAPLSTLSGGELQKVALASVLALQPQIVLLDEPTSQLDPVSAEELLSALRRLSEDTGSTILLAEHRVDRCLHLASRALFMENGSIVKDASPRRFCSWALHNRDGYVPPIARLAGSFPESPSTAAEDIRTQLPLTVKEGRAVLARLGFPPRLSGSSGRQDRRTRPEASPLLSAERLSIGYPPDAPVMENVSLSLYPGQFTALMGENGSGKSTLVRHLLGLRRPLSGGVFLDGRRIEEWSAGERAARCSLLTQNPRDYFVKETVEEEIRYSLQLRNIPGAKADALLTAIVSELHLAELLSRHPRDLSGGERTRAALALVAAGNPRVLLLDEPTRGLDPDTKMLLGQTLERWVAEGTAVLLVTHDVEFAARFADRIVIIGDGGIIADGQSCDVLDGSLFFSTQINRLLRRALPGVLMPEDVTFGDEEGTCAA